MTTPYLNRIPDEHDEFPKQTLPNPRLRSLVRRVVSRADIAHRYSSLDPQESSGQFSSHVSPWKGLRDMRSSAEIDFRLRVSPCELPELMDGDCSYEDFSGCLRSLEQINRWLLGYRPTMAWLEHLPHRFSETVHIVDVGCGSGDLLRKIAGWARRRGIAVQLTGIDLNPYSSCAAVESTPKDLGIVWVTGNALLYRPEKPADIVVSSLMAHHLEDEEIIALLRWMEATAQIGWFINDLERSERACRAFARVAEVVRWHRFVLHDGPVSFRRAFRKEDWVRLLAAAEVPRELATVEHWWPGRLCVGRWK